eukprot:7710488-Lingulodinium_polyedra.AAC.1
MEMGPESYQLPDDILQEVHDAAKGPNTTKPCEDGFNVLRKAAKSSGNGLLSRQGRWQHCLTTPLIKENDL